MRVYWLLGRRQQVDAKAATTDNAGFGFHLNADGGGSGHDEWGDHEGR